MLRGEAMVADWWRITIFSVSREKMAEANHETIRTGNPGRQFSFSTFFVCTKKGGKYFVSARKLENALVDKPACSSSLSDLGVDDRQAGKGKRLADKPRMLVHHSLVRCMYTVGSAPVEGGNGIL